MPMLGYYGIVLLKRPSENPTDWAGQGVLWIPGLLLYNLSTRMWRKLGLLQKLDSYVFIDKIRSPSKAYNLRTANTKLFMRIYNLIRKIKYKHVGREKKNTQNKWSRQFLKAQMINYQINRKDNEINHII